MTEQELFRKLVFVSDLKSGEDITTTFMVASFQKREKKNGETYLSMELSDRSGTIDAKMWDNVAEVGDIQPGQIAKVQGRVSEYQGKPQFTIKKLRLLGTDEVYDDMASYRPCSKHDPKLMYSSLRATVKMMEHEDLRNLVLAIIEDPAIEGRLMWAPAAKGNHHAYLGGLLEHILSMANVAALISDHYQVDRSLLITGCILHDIGKIYELSWDTAISYTDRGAVVGHIIMGIELVNKYAPANFPPRLLDMVKHLIISHHGRLEWASPKVPMTQEAILLHFLDDLDSKMAATSAAIEAPERQGVFTPYLAHMGRQICDVEEYVRG